MTVFDRKLRQSFGSGSPPAFPIDLSAKWESYVKCRVKRLRCVALSGFDTFVEAGYALNHATGVIELSGHREGLRETKLFLGFTAAAVTPLPTFALAPESAVGSISLPIDCFAGFLHIASKPGAYFQIGGDGKLNALASDVSGLSWLEGGAYK